MSPEQTAPLFQYGAIGVVLSLVLGLFLWAFKRLFNHVLDQQTDFKAFMNSTVGALGKISDRLDNNHEQVIEHLKHWQTGRRL